MTLRIWVWTLPSGISLAGEFWPTTIPGLAAQRSTNRARDIKSGIDMWSGETKSRANGNIAPLADTDRNLRFEPTAGASEISLGPALLAKPTPGNRIVGRVPRMA